MSKVVFITGASSGIGYQLALDFKERGYDVFAGARSVDKMIPLKEKGIETIQLDITSTDSILEAKQIIETKANGRLDILYNNAGISEKGSIFDIPKTTLQNSFNVNVIGTVEVIQIFQKLLIANKSTVVFTGSAIQYITSPFLFAYSSSKLAFSNISKTLALETQHFGIKIVQVLTGSVESNIWGFNTNKIPQSTIYKDENNQLILKSFDTDSKTPTSVYTNQVINDIEKIINKNTTENYFEIFRGKGINFAWLMGLIMPFRLFKKIVLKKLGLNEPLRKLAERLQGKKNV